MVPGKPRLHPKYRISMVIPARARPLKQDAATEVCRHSTTAYLIVRAGVDPAARGAFDDWYETGHLPDAVAALGSADALSDWSNVEENVHISFYRFPNLPAVRRVAASDSLKGEDRSVQPPL